MSLRRRVVGAAGAVAVAAVLLGVLIGVTVHRSQAAVQAENSRWAPAASRAQALLAHLVDQETGERGYLITGQDQYLQPYRLGMAAASVDIAALRRLVGGVPGVGQALDRVIAEVHAWRTQSAQPEITARQAGLRAASTLVRRGVGKRDFDDLRQGLSLLQTRIDQQRVAAVRRVRDADALVSTALWATAAVVALIGALLLWALRRWILLPLRRLSRVLRRVAGGDLDTTVAVAGPPDFVGLAADADAMRRRILDELAASERARQALEQRGPVVLGLSEQLTHRSGEPVPGLRYAVALQPVEGILAGDWVDVLPLGSDRVALLLVDVSGHGAAAGLEAVRLKHVLTTSLQLGHAPHEAFALAAAGFTDDERFATGVIAVVDLATGDLTWSNAGHISPCLVPLTDTTVDPDRVGELRPTGPMLSSFADGWQTARGRLEVGQLLLAFSDGLIEARDSGGREFGLAGVMGALSHTTLRDVDTAVSACVAAVRSYSSAVPRDDITVVAAARDAATLVPGAARIGRQRVG